MKKKISKTKKKGLKDMALLKEIRELILSARQAVVRNVNTIQVITNFEIGCRIVEHEQKGQEKAEYGEKLLRSLSVKLTKEFGKGFSKANLEYMRRFYLVYSHQPPITQTVSGQLRKTQTVSGQLRKTQTVSAQLTKKQKNRTVSGKLSQFTLSWSHYVFLMGLYEEERKFYEIEAYEQNWSLRELRRQFDTSLYERLALSRDKKGVRQLAQKGQIVEKSDDLLKEPYVLEFLGLDESAKYSESDLESAIIDKLEHFLLELGKGFLFEARQKRFTFDEEHYYVDLVFYNRLLRCYVLIDLKIGKITHQDLGQMQMYVNYFDRYEKTDGERSTIGIILCKENNSAVVEITLPKKSNIHAKEYRLYLPSKAQLKRKLLAWTKGKEVSR